MNKKNASALMLALCLLMIAMPEFSFLNGHSIAEASSKLGSLQKFRAIASGTRAVLEKGDLLAAKNRIKDLETSWDEAEPSLKPRDAAEWHKVDKAIDRALSGLRADSPELANCKKLMTELLAAMDHAS